MSPPPVDIRELEIDDPDPVLFDHLEKIPFNGKEYYAFRERDLFLRTRYGNYMELPPEDERVWKHYPILVDFQRNYEELEAGV